MSKGEWIEDIVSDYRSTVQSMDEDARESERSYGGYLRSTKGELVERMAGKMVKGAWSQLGGSPSRIDLSRDSVRVPIDRSYIEDIESDEIRKRILDNIDDYYYTIRVDLHTKIDDVPRIFIECKSYTENAMMKRVLFDFFLIDGEHDGDAKYVLFQLESQLGGDYSDPETIDVGSTSTRTLMSYFDMLDMEIMTLLEGERKVDEPIHDPEYYKDLQPEVVDRHLSRFGALLEPYL